MLPGTRSLLELITRKRMQKAQKLGRPVSPTTQTVARLVAPIARSGGFG